MLRAIAGKEALSFLNLPTNSAEKCCASEAEPPFPQIKSLLFFLKASAIILAAIIISLLLFLKSY